MERLRVYKWFILKIPEKISVGGLISFQYKRFGKIRGKIFMTGTLL